MNVMRYALVAFVVCVAGCASVKGSDGVRQESGVVLQKTEIPKTQNYGNRDYAAAMTGIFGLLLVDAIYEDPKHFSYSVQLESGKKVTLRNTTEVMVGSCVRVWLKAGDRTRDDFYPLKFNDIEEVSPCANTTLPGQPETPK